MEKQRLEASSCFLAAYVMCAAVLTLLLGSAYVCSFLQVPDMALMHRLALHDVSAGFFKGI